ncbi:MAG: IS66 family transposase [Archangium sp.]|nr:IS66 family transposase [Archangium sp.]
MAVRPHRKAHQCEWRDKAEALEGQAQALKGEVSGLKDSLARMQQELAALTRRVLGPKSEKMPPIEKELRGGKPADAQQAKKKRAERRKSRANLTRVRTVHEVAAADRHCPECAAEKFSVMPSRTSTVYEYVPAHFIAHEHVRQVLRCECGVLVAAHGPDKWLDKSQYGASFVAHLVTAKCADSIPLYRLEKEYQRIGVPVARSTMTDLFLRAAELLEPLSGRLLELIRNSSLVHADETSKKVQAEGKCRTGYMWNFRTAAPDPLIAYVFAPSRSSETPKRVLGGTRGELMADGYTGYNAVSDVDGRRRSACYAHVRRYFFDAMPTAPEAREVLDIIRELYRVEREAQVAGLLGTPAHLELRKTKSAPVREKLKVWLVNTQKLHPPKSPLGEAIRYTMNRWAELGHFLEDAKIPLDNNPSESALRRVALGRKNFLFVGNDAAGEKLAGLYSLVATCEANDVNPLAYVEDVLTRIGDHPSAKIDDLLPHRWIARAAAA